MANLMGNAVKFTASGQVLLGVRARKVAASGEQGKTSVMVQIVVRDSGIGMTAEAKAKLFQAFTQADGSTTRVYGGSGLGLAITKSLVDAMGGTIRVKSAPGRGSTFSVLVPLLHRPDAAGEPGEQFHGRTLVVDDNATNRRVIEHYLEHWDVMCESVASASNGLEKLRMAARTGERFDVVLLDHQMPEMDGLAFLRAMRADPIVASTPCVMMSSLGGRMAETESLDVSEWLSKPVRRAELLQSLLQARREKPREPLKAEKPQMMAASSDARVLLVEDNEVNRLVALRILKNLGIAASAVVNGQEAVTTVQTSDVDLVLMDCQMPVMDGYAATAAIRAWEDEQRVNGRDMRVPIVAMTANAMPTDRDKCLAAGMDDYVSKPIKAEILAKILKIWLPLRRQENAGSAIAAANRRVSLFEQS